MIRYVFIFLLFSASIVFEMAFLHSLPQPLSLLPWMILVSVFLYQYLGLSEALWFLPLFGFLIDTLSLFPVRFVTIAYICAAFVLLLFSRTVFTHRSLYGFLGAVASVLTAFYIALAFLELSQTIVGSLQELQVLLRDYLLSFLLSAGTGLLLFPFASRFKRLLTDMVVLK